jgi:hypothetical protein
MKNTKHLLMVEGIPIASAIALIKSSDSLIEQRFGETAIAFPNLSGNHAGNNPFLISKQAKNHGITPRTTIRRLPKQCSRSGPHKILMKNQNFAKALHAEIKRDDL